MTQFQESLESKTTKLSDNHSKYYIFHDEPFLTEQERSLLNDYNRRFHNIFSELVRNNPEHKELLESNLHQFTSIEKLEYFFILYRKKYSHFITLTFPFKISLRKALKYLKEFLERLNWKLTIKHGCEKCNPINGAGITEESSNQGIHFHVLLESDNHRNSHFSQDEVTKLIKSVINELSTPKANSTGRAKIFKSEGTDIQEVYEKAGLIVYLLKDGNQTTIFGDSINFFTGGDITEIDARDINKYRH
jgi:hypothetical protein